MGRSLWRCALTVACSLLVPALAVGAEGVGVGKGSYAGSVPADVAAKAGKIEQQALNLVDPALDRPIPTNQWWTQLLVAPYAKSLWCVPLKLEARPEGLDVFFPVQWNDTGSDPVSDFPVTLGGEDFRPTAAKAKDWSDWMVTLRLDASPGRWIDVTLGRGMPAVWAEYHGVAHPTLTLGRPDDPLSATLFDLAGHPLRLPTTGESVGLTYHDRSYALFAPAGTRFTLQGSRLALTFAGEKQFVVLCPLPRPGDIALFHKYAYAIPRKTTYTYDYDPAKGRVRTHWQIDAEPLQGTNTQVLQGWLPHHYHDTTNNLSFTPLTYLSPRGPLKVAAGNRFDIAYPFTGVLPNLPAPEIDTPPGPKSTHPFDPQRMQHYLEEVAAKPDYGADTYWGGKDVLRFAQAALIAQQLDSRSHDALLTESRAALTDWLTYTPGEKEHFFAYYPKWRSLIGINPSYGSEGFNDHHFHYGYFTFAAGLLAMQDRQFATDYGPMATLLAKDYANWDRTDRRFPFFRTFDIWEGHSWASGTSSPGGQNQESSSEAMQSWAGLVFLGQALGDRDMLAAGAMGYAVESRATMAYWFNQTGDVFPAQWKHPATGMVWGGGKAFGTFFTGDPAWVYAINWLPVSPVLSYLVRDPAFARQMYAHMQHDFTQHEQAEAKNAHRAPRPPTTETFGAALGNVLVGYQSLYDPAGACAELDRLWHRPNDDIAHNAGEFTTIYYLAHAQRALGPIDWTCRTSSPTSMVYLNGATRTRTYVVWNPLPTPQTVTVYDNDEPIGTLTAAPQSLTRTTRLQKE